ncbi:MAG: hypothetical protein ABIQ74_13270 [Chitinophagales bacterium]
MKTLRFIMLMLAGFTILSVWNSCKKGPEDPFFSIRSRKQRVCGDWTVSEFKVNFVDSIRRVVDSIPNGSGSCGAQSEKNIDVYNYTWSFDKHGGYTQKLNLYHDHYVDIVTNSALCPDAFEHDSVIIVTVSAWNFVGNVGDFKNKEQLFIFDEETKLATIYNIIELREKEMKLETSTINPDSNTVYLKQYTLTQL